MPSFYLFMKLLLLSVGFVLLNCTLHGCVMLCFRRFVLETNKKCSPEVDYFDQNLVGIGCPRESIKMKIGMAFSIVSQLELNQVGKTEPILITSGFETIAV